MIYTFLDTNWHVMGGGRCVLLFLAAAVVVTFLAYERDEVVRDAELILHHNLTNHGEARAAPVATEKGYILPDAATSALHPHLMTPSFRLMYTTRVDVHYTCDLVGSMATS